MSTTVLPLCDARSLLLKILTFLCNQRRLSNNHLLEPCVEKNMHFKVVNKRKLWIDEKRSVTFAYWSGAPKDNQRSKNELSRFELTWHTKGGVLPAPFWQ